MLQNMRWLQCCKIVVFFSFFSGFYLWLFPTPHPPFKTSTGLYLGRYRKGRGDLQRGWDCLNIPGFSSVWAWEKNLRQCGHKRKKMPQVDWSIKRQDVDKSGENRRDSLCGEVDVAWMGTRKELCPLVGIHTHFFPELAATIVWDLILCS